MRAKKIILITLDTLRADRLGCYGYRLDTSPAIDAFSKEATLFKHAFAACSYTLPSHASMLSGRYPANMSLFYSQGWKGSMDNDRDLMLQEALSDKGYETAAFISALPLRRQWGLEAGFRLYDDVIASSDSRRPGEQTNQNVFAWLAENHKKDFFMWVHYFDVHAPYVNPEPFASHYRLEDYGPIPVLLNTVYGCIAGGIPDALLLRVERDMDGRVIGYERDARHYFSQYDAGVRHVDHVVGKLFDELRHLGIYQETAVILTSDHGEALGEGGVYFMHGLTVTPEQVSVPLLMKLPGGEGGESVVDAPVSLVDIMPTVLELAGVDRSMFRLDSVPLSHAGTDEYRLIISENEWQRAFVMTGVMFLSEKAMISDGLTYHTDSKALCTGARALDYRSGKELALDGGGTVGELLRLAQFFHNYIDPKEVTIRISRGEIEWHIGELKRCKGAVECLEEKVKDLLASNSWRVTAPLRRLMELIQGLKMDSSRRAGS